MAGGMSGAAATAEVSAWRDPTAEPPPRGCKLLILTRAGVSILGPWRNDVGHQAWSPLPRRPAWLRVRSAA